jgi:hypothetical protein
MGVNTWQDDVLQMIYSNPDGRSLDAKAIQVVSKLMADEKLESESQRVAEFRRKTGLSRRTYFRYRQSLREAQGECENGDTLTPAECQSATDSRSPSISAA